MKVMLASKGVASLGINLASANNVSSCTDIITDLKLSEAHPCIPCYSHFFMQTLVLMDCDLSPGVAGKG